MSAANAVLQTSTPGVSDRSRVPLARRLIALRAFWARAILTLGGLATIAWVGSLAWFAIRGALRLLHVV